MTPEEIEAKRLADEKAAQEAETKRKADEAAATKLTAEQEKEIDRRVKAALAANEAEAKRKADEEKALQEGKHTEIIQAREQEIATLKAEKEKAERAALCIQAAANHSLPKGWAERLKGDTAEEIDKDAETMAADIVRTAPETDQHAGGDKGKGFETKAHLEKRYAPPQAA
jgi:hypothetical protein